MRFIFLIYDSRSGSTYLSKKIYERFSEALVTPEINLCPAIKIMRNAKPTWSILARKLDEGRFFSSLGLSRDAMEKYYDLKSPFPLANFLDHAFFDYASKRGKPDTKVIVIKKGDHFKVVEQIIRLIPGVKFIFLRRDPRGIYESKKRTKRPYRPRETMAWGGVLAAAIRWIQYERFVEKVAFQNRVHIVSFEELGQNEERVLQDIGGFLTVTKRNVFRSEYKIADMEERIHAKAVLPVVNRSEINAWRKKLSKFELLVIETILRKRMGFVGYEPTTRGGIICFVVIPIAVLDMIIKILATFIVRLWGRVIN